MAGCSREQLCHRGKDTSGKSHAPLTVTDDVQIMTLGNRRPHPRRRRRRGLLIGLVLWGAALLTELAKPAGERTWEGRIAGIVPYDLRRPTVARLRQRVWNTDDRRIVVPTAFGVGWTVNVGGLLARLRSS